MALEYGISPGSSAFSIANLALPITNLEYLSVFVCNPCLSELICYLASCGGLAWALEGQEPEDDDD